MTIKDFARLCGCKAQTLRYYDRKDLLKPARVDPWSGYRYYDEDQALTFVKIKNLQSADFTIEEIKALLGADRDVIYEAFNRKIAQQEDKLNNIKRIQRSYRSEMSEMEKKIKEVQAQVARDMEAYDPWEEFGITREEYGRIVDHVNEAFTGIAPDNGDFDYSVYPDGDDSAEETVYLDLLNDPNYEVIYESHGWDHVKDFFDQLETPKSGNQYVFHFEVSREKANQTAFANTVLGVMIGKNYGGQKDNGQKLQCNVTFSQDGKNHFWLLRRK